MVFNSLHFVWFFIVVYAAYRLLPHRGQNWLLLVASYYFYAAWDWRFLGLLIASTLVDFTCGLWLGRSLSPRTRRALLCVSLGFNLVLLGFFKYFNFFADSLHTVFGALGWQLDWVTVRVLLPVGISFYTFVTMSYVIDVYRREIAPTRSLLDFAVFVAYFPHLVAGPILRASRLLPQIASPRHVTREQMRDGAWLVAWGFFQKIFVADNLAGIANLVFDPAAHPTGVNVLLGTYAFAFQIYGDFAGYSNVARGTSKLMGIELIENFRFPYLVRTRAGLLASLAHQPVHVAARLPLHPARREPRDGRAHAPQPAHHDGPRRALARRGVDVRPVGRVPRTAAHRLPRRRSRAGPAGLADRGRRARASHVVGGDVPPDVLRLAHLPRAIRPSAPGDVLEPLHALCPASANVEAILVPLLMYTTPLLLVHAIEALHDDLLIVPRLAPGVRYSLYAATFYLTMLFGNFGGAEFIYFQF